ncbi:MAG TPA: histidine kinase dimerization/phosphoacceptor domain-containing protein [Actinomycetota bacterium]|jgi:hypothetical protein|nr:histidine kinase dimerization/phosphoacceptor domain-containing protein [Actinomycetota bacterium]
MDALNQAYVGILLATVLIALGYLTGTRRRLKFELVEGRRREQEGQARSTLLEERARIARELHDVVDHHMSVIAVRAATAPFRIPGLPEAVKDDMAETSAIAREALAEMRRLLSVLRGADTDAERVPQPGMDRLEGLVAAVRGAGLTVDARVEGDQRPSLTACGSASATTGRRLLVPTRCRARSGTASSACASGWPCSAAPCRPGRPATAATWSRRSCSWRRPAEGRSR